MVGSQGFKEYKLSFVSNTSEGLDAKSSTLCPRREKENAQRSPNQESNPRLLSTVAMQRL